MNTLPYWLTAWQTYWLSPLRKYCSRLTCLLTYLLSGLRTRHIILIYWVTDLPTYSGACLCVTSKRELLSYWLTYRRICGNTSKYCLADLLIVKSAHNTLKCWLTDLITYSRNCGHIHEIIDLLTCRITYSAAKCMNKLTYWLTDLLARCHFCGNTLKYSLPSLLSGQYKIHKILTHWLACLLSALNPSGNRWTPATICSFLEHIVFLIERIIVLMERTLV
jgi:hypothetical protein